MRFVLMLALLQVACHGAAQEQSRQFAIREFRIEGNTLVDAGVLQDVLLPQLGPARNAESLLAVREAVLGAYLRAGYAMVSVEVSAAEARNGVIVVRISEVRIGRVAVAGNRQFSESMIRAALPELREGEAPRLGQLARQLFLANDNGALSLALEYQPASGGRADVAIKTTEKDANRYALTLDNTGSVATGRSRAGAIAHFANLWDRGHIGTFSFVKSLEQPERVTQFGLFYVAPLPALGDQLQFTAVHSDSNAGRVADAFNVSGQGDIAGLRYVRTLLRDAFGKQTLAGGMDLKYYKNTTDFEGTNLGVDVNARPVALAYAYNRWLSEAVNVSFGAQYNRNLPGGDKNDDATYGASRAGAVAGWSSWRVNATAQHAWKSGWLLLGAFDGQYSGEPLISAEQFGLGGARSVRGFEERETAGDRGYRASVEVQTPVIAESQRLLAFIDMGRQARLNVQPGEQAGEGLLSYGVGWRASWKNGLNVAADLGIVADGTPTTPRGEYKLHASVAWWF